MENAATKKRWNSPERLIIFGLLIALVFTISGFEIASASIPDSNGVIHGCLKGKKNQLFIINTATTPSCPTNETPVNWGGSQPGQLLYQNATGFRGPYTSGQTIATFTVPAGLMCLQGTATAYTTGSPPQQLEVKFLPQTSGFPEEAIAAMANESNSHKALVLSIPSACVSVQAGTVTYQGFGITGGTFNTTSDNNDYGSLSVQVYSQ
jgi:hypothetical protein